MRRGFFLDCKEGQLLAEVEIGGKQLVKCYKLKELKKFLNKKLLVIIFMHLQATKAATLGVC